MSMNAVLPTGKTMPLWGDLGKLLEADLSDFSANGALDAISAYEHEYGRARLIERLTEVLQLASARPGDAHRSFCAIKFDLVCTTNFDFLLENQYLAIPHFVNPVVDEEQLSLNVTKDGTQLLKLHGDVRHPSRLVVTEGDYDAFLTKYPLIATYLANLLITRTAVLIGYSLDDPDFRQVWQIVSQRLGKTRRQAYAIGVGMQPADVARFARRGVTVINLPKGKKKYGEVLSAAFDELAAYWSQNVLKVSTVTEEEPLRELSLPTSSRLVFFAIPLHRLSLYRERVFPSVQALGLVPVTADDVVSPGNSVSAKIDALMDKAVAIVVELGSNWTAAELQIALGRVRENTAEGQRTPRVIVLRDSDATIPENLSRFVALRINISDESGDGWWGLIDQLRQVVPVGAQQMEEPRRLLEAGEYRSAVISSMSVLEAALRRSLEKPDWSRVRRPMSIRQLVEVAIERQILTPANLEPLEPWVRLRNEVVHANASVSRVQADEMVRGVAAILARLQ